MSLALDKWYLDLVTAEGAAVIAYVVDVGWRGLDLRLVSQFVSAPGARPDERTTLGQSTALQIAGGDRVSLTSEALGLHGTWQALDAPVKRTLLDSPAGRIEWSCLMPRARAGVVTATGRYEGLGYAEHVRLTMPPWALPFRTLRWGRHVSDRHSLVWIEWDGEPALQTAWLDGSPQPGARVVASGVSGLEDHQTLRWQDGRDLTRRNVGAAIETFSPVLAARVAGRLARMQEHKQLSPSALVDGEDRPLDTGWAIHEVVTW